MLGLVEDLASACSPLCVRNRKPDSFRNLFFCEMDALFRAIEVALASLNGHPSLVNPFGGGAVLCFDHLFV